MLDKDKITTFVGDTNNTSGYFDTTNNKSKNAGNGKKKTHDHQKEVRQYPRIVMLISVLLPKLKFGSGPPPITYFHPK